MKDWKTPFYQPTPRPTRVSGPDATEFLQKMWSNSYNPAKLKILLQ